MTITSPAPAPIATEPSTRGKLYTGPEAFEALSAYRWKNVIRDWFELNALIFRRPQFARRDPDEPRNESNEDGLGTRSTDNDDLANEARLAVWSYSGPPRILSYFKKIARNAWCDLLRAELKKSPEKNVTRAFWNVLNGRDETPDEADWGAGDYVQKKNFYTPRQREFDHRLLADAVAKTNEERRREGMRSAARNGKHVGRPKGSKANTHAILELHKRKFSVRQIAEVLCVSKSTVARVLSEVSQKGSGRHSC